MKFSFKLVDNRALVEGGFPQKVSCIKAIRMITGAGLKEAKDLCEYLIVPVRDPGQWGVSKHTPNIGIVYTAPALRRLDPSEDPIFRANEIKTLIDEMMTKYGIEVVYHDDGGEQVDAQVAELRDALREANEKVVRLEAAARVPESIRPYIRGAMQEMLDNDRFRDLAELASWAKEKMR